MKDPEYNYNNATPLSAYPCGIFHPIVGFFRRCIMKQCAKCKSSKEATSVNFPPDKKTKDGFYSYCRPCNREIQKKWRQENKKKLSDYQNNYQKKRRAEDIQFRIACGLRSRLSITMQGKKKYNKTLDYLSITLSDFKIYIEKQFTEGMSWDNYGDWHLDHIKPVVSFDHTDEEQIKECWHYTNFQPLWATDNIKKSDKIMT